MNQITFESIHLSANGCWPQILTSLGINADLLSMRHGPCPGCGGTDRFRFDDIDGRGTWFCGGGGDEKSGDGFALIAHVFGCSTSDALHKVASHLGLDRGLPLSAKKVEELVATNRARHDAQIKKEAQAIVATVCNANTIWRAAKPAKDRHPYLIAKAVRAFALRQREHNGVDELLVPLINISGELRNIERIMPPNFARAGNKRVLGPGVNGLFHLLGADISSLCTNKIDTQIIIAEGYATAASLHMALNLPVVAARSASNIGNVYHAFRDRFPQAILVIAMDNDDAAQKSVAAFNADRNMATIKPVFADADYQMEKNAGRSCKDFNDYHRLYGLDAIRVMFEQKRMTTKTASSKGATTDDSISTDTTSPPSKTFGPYRLTESGLYFSSDDSDDSDIYVCSPIEVIANTRDAQSDGWGILIKLSDLDGKEKELNIPNRFLHTEGAVEAVGLLVHSGLKIGAHRRCKPLLIAYLKQVNSNERVTIVHKLGWHGNLFLLPDKAIGVSEDRLLFEQRNRITNPAKCSGTLDGWRSEISAYAIGNPRLMFSLCVAFAAPLLELIGAESGGFHFFGDSSLGKTTLLQVASSVWGGPNYMQTWRATDNALESICVAYSDCLLPLDELGQCAAEVAGEAVYMIGNGRGKARANESGLIKRNTAEWRLLFLSNGEHTLERHLADAGRALKAGMEVRMIAIPADAGKSHGLFNTIAFSATDVWASAAALSSHLVAASSRHYGHAAVAFLNRLIVERKHLPQAIRDAQIRFVQQLQLRDASGQAIRAANRFALAGYAGELATKWGVTGWPAGAATNAATECFHAWAEHRGGVGRLELSQMQTHIRQFFSKYRYSHFREWSRSDDAHAPAPRECYGYVKTHRKNNRQQPEEQTEQTTFYVNVDSFRNDICKGFNYKLAEKWLVSIDALKAERNGDRSPSMTRSEQIPGMSRKQRFYVVTEAVLSQQEFG